MATEPLLDGLFKNVYASKIEDLIPKSNKLQQEISFDVGEKIGLQFNQPVMLSDEGGATYNTSTQASAFSLNAAVGGIMQNAQISGSEIVLRSWLPYRDAARATSGGEAAFTSATELQVKNNIKSARKRLEIALLYGGSGLATTASSANVNATTTDVTFTAATWATAMWSGMINSVFNFYDAGVIVGTNGTTDTKFVLTSITPSTRVVRFTSTAQGITDLDAAIVADPTTVLAYFDGAFGEECVGLDAITTNTGTLFNISASTYDLWKGNTYTTTGALTLGKILNGLAGAVGRGLDEDGILLVNPNTWQDLSTNEAALRRYDSSYKSSEAMNGNESICYYGQNGKVEIMPHLFVKGGNAFFFVPDRMKRIGSVDVTFEQPGTGGRIFFNIPDRAAYEFRSYTDQALFCEKPTTLVKFSGFTNSSG